MSVSLLPNKVFNLQKPYKKYSRDSRPFTPWHLQCPDHPLRKQQYSKIGNCVEISRRDVDLIIAEATPPFDEWIPGSLHWITLESNHKVYRNIIQDYDSVQRMCAPEHHIRLLRR